ncbi:unnamed protein product [Clonostachys rosea]|uniref:Major facilitator superfamily (MFS) profile domain-containing protein n=1 Tax=Bionectria ochroleuca TaxID=29856 RepID=A0ABY6UF75_BIOOC|nr:unnamed protein product [Clonostachys rosea]
MADSDHLSKRQENVAVESAPSNTDDVSDQSFVEPTPQVKKSFFRKADFWLVGFYSFVYIFRVLDSSNYANAAIINLENGTNIRQQLGFNASQWSWTQSMFSYSYMVFEPTNTIMLKAVRPSRWMFLIIFFWGVCASCTSAVQGFKGMMCLRFALGMAEAGFYPSVLFHMAFWYKPSEMPQRIAIFYSVGQVAGAISGLLAYAIGHMDGLGGLPGWRWLFLLEGLPAILLSFVALWKLPNYPETAKLLNEEERKYATTRLVKTAPQGKKGNWDYKSLLVLVKDPTFYTFSLFWICHGIGGFGVGVALPTVIYDLGFTTTANTQLMNMPPYVSACIFLNIIGYLLHKKILRPWTTAVAIEVTIMVCYVILFTVSIPTVRYIVLIVAISCAGSAYPVIWPERIRALEGTVAAGIGIGWTNAMAQFSGIVGPHVYSSVFGPSYRVSYGICMSFLVVGVCMILTSWYLIRRKDKNRSLEFDGQ